MMNIKGGLLCFSIPQIIMDNNNLLDVHIINHSDHDHENPLVGQANEANKTNREKITKFRMGY
jgi:hypothetical protein